MAKEKRYWYECIYETDLGYWAPDQRRERWVQKGRSLIQPMRVLHSVRLYPSRGVNSRGEPLPPDYACFLQPLAKQYTEEVTKRVSRPNYTVTGRRAGRVMRPKTSKVKFRQLDSDELTDYVRRNAYFFDEWHESLFIDADKDVYLPGENKGELPPEDDENPREE